jgi:tRNA/tmRNA/rRNA uracil-C5-methylase (TrmA/RlmC/RlmD family)
MKKPILIAAGILVVLIGIRTIMTLGKPDDKQLVREALAESIAASKEGRPGGVMDKISDKLMVNNQQVASMRQIANWIRDAKPDVEVPKQDPVIVGDEAQITSPVRVKLSLPGGSGFDQTIQDVTLVFAKESATEWLIIPTTKWRLREVKLPENVMDQFSGLGAFGGFGGLGGLGF